MSVGGFLADYNVRVPLVQAGMAFASMTPDLALAVSGAGAVGALGAGNMPPDLLDQALAQLTREDRGCYHVNLISFFDTAPQLEVIQQYRVPVVSFHWGCPDAAVIASLQAGGSKVWVQVGNVADAVAASNQGANAIIVQGLEAGVHCYGEHSLLTLVAAARGALPEQTLIAAGGIANGAAMAAAIAQGADAAMAGTRFLATPEAYVHDEHKRRIVAAGADDTVLTSMFGPQWPAFNPMRVLRNQIVVEHGHDANPVEDGKQQPVIGTMPLGDTTLDIHRFDTVVPVRGSEADWEAVPWLAGQGVAAINDIVPAAEVVMRMAREFEAASVG